MTFDMLLDGNVIVSYAVQTASRFSGKHTIRLQFIERKDAA
jgi:hypothetical protein